MTASARVADHDHGYAQLVKAVFGLGKPRIEVGVLEKDGEQPKREHDGTLSNATTVIQVASWMEFGFHHAKGNFDVLPRSFIRDWFDENRDDLRRKLVGQMRLVLLGRKTKDQVLEQMGLYCVGEIQKRIANGIPPPLADSTIAQKGSSQPLIDTGQLRSSISYRVTEGGK